MHDLGTLIFVTVILCAIGFIFGSIGENNHYRSIVEREANYRRILMFNEKHPPATIAGHDFFLVTGSVVMSGDYFKQMVAALKQLFGGRLTSFESMLDRGRREALLRMKEEAASKGATMIFNVSFQTTMLNNSGQRKGSVVCAEFLAYGTAATKPKSSVS